MNWNLFILPVIRHGLQIVSGYLLATGHLDPENAETLSGALLAIISVGWWFFTKPSKEAAEVAKQVDKGSPVTVHGPQGGKTVINPPHTQSDR